MNDKIVDSAEELENRENTSTMADEHQPSRKRVSDDYENNATGNDDDYYGENVNENGGQEKADEGQKNENGGQKQEEEGQKNEDGRQKKEEGGQKKEKVEGSDRII